jgi:hypothetical protein
MNTDKTGAGAYPQITQMAQIGDKDSPRRREGGEEE